jgi:hypothetical protein
MAGHNELHTRKDTPQPKANFPLPEWVQVGVNLVDENHAFCLRASAHL